MAFTGPIAPGDIERLRTPMAKQRQRLDRTARHLAADRQLDPGRPHLLHHKM